MTKKNNIKNLYFKGAKNPVNKVNHTKEKLVQNTFSRRPRYSSSQKNRFWIDKSIISNPESKKHYKLLLLLTNKKYCLTKKNNSGKKLVKKLLKKNTISSFFYTHQNLNWNLKNIKKLYSKIFSRVQTSRTNFIYNKNIDIVNIEFYQLWFYRATLRNILNKKSAFILTAEGRASQLWRTFRRARYDQEARKLRNMLKLNWTNSLYYRAVATLGPHYFKPLKNLNFKMLQRLKRAKQHFKTGTDVFKNGLRVRMLFGKNYTSKKYAPQRKNWRFSKKLSRLYYLHARLNLLRYKILKHYYLKHVTRYNFISFPRRLLSYFNILSYINRGMYNRSSFRPRWINYFNLTKRRSRGFFSLFKKRIWSAEHNINTPTLDLFRNLRTLPLNSITNRVRDIFDCRGEEGLVRNYKPIRVYKKFKKENLNIYLKSRLNNKFFVKSRNAVRAVVKLKRKIKKLQFKLYRQHQSDLNNFLVSFLKKKSYLSKKAFRSVFLLKYINAARNFIKTPTALYAVPKHLRFFKKTNYLGVVISITQKNYFFTLVKANTGEVKKVFSSGYSRAKTTRIRRSPIMFTKVFNLFMDYLKSKNISKLKFVRVVQPSLVPKNTSFGDQKKINWYPNQFKHARIRVRRWIYELKRVHGLPLRGPKLRRK